MRVADVFLPPACAGCGRYGAVLCRRCVTSLRPASRDEDRFLAADPGVVVGDALEVALAAFAYGGPLRRALAGLKYGSAARVAAPLADQATDALRPLLAVAPDATLVPVPVHGDRLRERGYNQAALIARHLSHAAGRPVADVLQRSRATTKQHRLDRAARLRNLHGAFAIIPGREPPRTVIVVDDILTTSATLEACAGVLREAGADRVLGFTIAREL
jgi:ComF family protein